MVKKQRIIRLVRFGLRAAIFIILMLCLCFYALYVLTPKSDYGICSMITYYEQPAGTVDVLVLGTSAAYCGINTNVLWEQYGIAAYNLCGAEMPYWAIYYYLKEALKTQTPKVILLDAKPSIYMMPYSKKARVVMSTYGIRSLINRIGSIIAGTHPDNTLKFITGFSVIHDNFENLEASDFRYPTDNGGRGESWKGYIEMDYTDEFIMPEIKPDQPGKELQEREQYYLEKILKLAGKAGIPVSMIGMPTPDYAYDYPYYLGLKEVTDKYKAGFLNYNQSGSVEGLDYSCHFADWQHLNIAGSAILSGQLGKDLLSRYDLEDHRGDNKWKSWQTCADIWFAGHSIQNVSTD